VGLVHQPQRLGLSSHDTRWSVFLISISCCIFLQ
jgi:hypothetical protein